MENENAKQSFERADQQRFMSLKLAFETLDVFAFPSLSPEQMDAYSELKKYLLNKYKPRTTEWVEIMYGDDIDDKLTG